MGGAAAHAGRHGARACWSRAERGLWSLLSLQAGEVCLEIQALQSEPKYPKSHFLLCGQGKGLQECGERAQHWWGVTRVRVQAGASVKTSMEQRVWGPQHGVACIWNR